MAAVATLASSVDYTTSDSALKLLIPLVRDFMLYHSALESSTRIDVTVPLSSFAAYLLETSFTGQSCRSSECSSCSAWRSVGCRFSSFDTSSICIILA